MSKENKLLVIAPHPDDETLGCGGTILRYKKAGSRVSWLNVTAIKEEYGFDCSAVRKRTAEVAKVNKAYGFDGYYDLGLKPTGLDEYPLATLVKKISGVIERVKPDIVILPYNYDVHSDHRIVSDASLACTKAFRYPYMKKVMMMEVLSETTEAASGAGKVFSPNCFIDVSAYIEKKINMMKIYESEYGVHPFPRSERSIRALATLRGAAAGMEYAESFMILREAW